MKNYVLITLGTGLGCAVVVNGRLVDGEYGLSGEFGHSVAVFNGRACGCGNKGCLETYVSASGLVRNVFELLSNSKEPSFLRNYSYNDITAEKVFKAADNQDTLAIQAFTMTGTILGRKLSDLVTLLDPEAIILSGGLVAAGNLLLEPILGNMEASFFEGLNKSKILFSDLEINEAAILGAASLFWIKEKELFV